MRLFKRKKSLCLVLMFFVVLLSAAAAQAQTISFNYYYKFDMSGAGEPPQITGLSMLDYPDAALKNGTFGTLKASLTLGEDGKTRDVVVSEGLPDGVTEVFTKILQNMYFQPAKINGTPVATKMTIDFIVTAEYGETDKNVSKPKIVEKPAPVYPPNQLAEKVKGKVQVQVMFFADGKLKVLGVNSTMPREFDRAALEAAAKIKFQPAVHKKSKKTVTQQMTVEYDFKP